MLPTRRRSCDMEADRTEMHDLAAQCPDIVKAMSAAYADWAKSAHVEPKPDNAGKRKAKSKSRNQ